MGLLDSMNLDDPQTMGLLSAAGSMFQASGPSLMPHSFGQVLGAGLSGGMGAYQGAQDRNQAQAMQVEKLKMLKLQEQRAQAQFKMQQDAYNGIGQPQPSSMMGDAAQDGAGGAMVAGQPQPVGAVGTGGGMGGSAAKLDQLRRMAIAGIPGAKEMFDIYKYETEPQKLEQGSTYLDRRTGSERTMPKLDNGITMRPDGSAGYVPGYAASVAEQAGLTTDAQEKAKANYNTTTLNLPGGPRLVSNAQLPAMLGAGGPNGAPIGIRNNNPGNLRPPGASTGFQQFATPEEGIAALDKNLQSYGNKGVNTITGIISKWAPPSENNTKAYIDRVSKQLGINPNQPLDMSNPLVRHQLSGAIMLHENGAALFRSGGNNPNQSPQSGPGIALQSEAQKEAEVGAAKTQNALEQARLMEKQTNSAKSSKLYQQLGAALPQARELLKTATGSGFGALVDSGMGFAGKSTPSSTAADQLETLGGWMTANVPRMEGPQSDADVRSYKTMSGMVGDRTKPNASRLKALDTLEALQNKYAVINGSAPAVAPAAPTPISAKKSALKGQVMDGYRFKGGNPADQNNWEKM